MLLMFAAAQAATPELAVVGLHVDRLTPGAADEAAQRLVEALQATGRVKVLNPEQVGRRIAGTEPYILDNFALGRARDRVKEAQLLYDRAELDQAVPVLDEAIEGLAAGLAYTTDSRELRAALVLKGMALQGMGEEGPARDAFARAATLDIGAELDTVNHSPAVVALYNDVRRELRTDAPAWLDVSSSVEATVFVDGKEIGPAPQRGIQLVPGQHFLLVRSPDGGANFTVFEAASGESLSRNELLERRGIGQAADDPVGRTRQTRELYRAFGAYSKGAMIVLAGSTPTGVAVQLYSPSSGNFSKVLTAPDEDDPVAAVCDLAPALVAYVSDAGDVRADKVSPQVAPLDIGANEILARLIFEEKSTQAVVVEKESKGVPWWVWAGGAVVLAGGGAAVGVVLATQEPEEGDQGTISLGPLP